MKKQIIAIGGGGFGRTGTPTALETYLVAQTGKQQPKVCFLPQASAESHDYIERFKQTFNALNAQPTWVSLFGRVNPDWKEILLAQDLIYVGGGNTRSMLALWREWGVDDILRQAYDQGTVLAGVSAGALCWFEQCITDSVWPLGVINGLGLIKGSCCPHYDSEPERRPTFTAKVAAQEVQPGIGLEDGVAAHFIDGNLAKIVSLLPNKNAYFVTEHSQEILPAQLL